MLCINDILILLIFFSAEPDSTPRPIMDFNRIYDCGLLIVCECGGGADCRDNDDSLQSAVTDSQSNQHTKSPGRLTGLSEFSCLVVGYSVRLKQNPSRGMFPTKLTDI